MTLDFQLCATETVKFFHKDYHLISLVFYSGDKKKQKQKQKTKTQHQPDQVRLIFQDKLRTSTFRLCGKKKTNNKYLNQGPCLVWQRDPNMLRAYSQRRKANVKAMSVGRTRLIHSSIQTKRKLKPNRSRLGLNGFCTEF